MSTVNVPAREVAAKIVYYGPGLSGKTTNLRRIHDVVKPSARGEMTALATEGDRTLFFDFLPVKVERINNFALRLGLYTVPGQVFYNATRKLVLQGSDGVVFIADSQPDALDRNVESLENLADNLRDEGLDLAQVPLVIQYNKRDLSRVLPIERLREALNAFGAPEFEASATEGLGVMDSLKAITRLVIRDLKARGVVAERASGGQVPVEVSTASLEAQIRELADGGPAAPARPGSAFAQPAYESGEPGRSLADDRGIEDTDPSARPATARVRPQTPAQGPRATLSPGDRDLWEPDAPPAGSFLAELAPASLRGEVTALEVSFAVGDHAEVVDGALRVVRALARVDRGEELQAGYLLGLDGRELRRLLEARDGSPDRAVAALSLSLLAQACVRGHT